MYIWICDDLDGKGRMDYGREEEEKMDNGREEKGEGEIDEVVVDVFVVVVAVVVGGGGHGVRTDFVSESN